MSRVTAGMDTLPQLHFGGTKKPTKKARALGALKIVSEDARKTVTRRQLSVVRSRAAATNPWPVEVTEHEGALPPRHVIKVEHEDDVFQVMNCSK
jgi:adenine-specific DNA methylase